MARHLVCRAGVLSNSAGAFGDGQSTGKPVIYRIARKGASGCMRQTRSRNTLRRLASAATGAYPTNCKIMTACRDGLEPQAFRQSQREPPGGYDCRRGLRLRARFGDGSFATGCLEPCGKRHRGRLSLWRARQGRNAHWRISLGQPLQKTTSGVTEASSMRTERTQASKIACRARMARRDRTRCKAK